MSKEASAAEVDLASQQPSDDDADMYRMGKRQQFQRNFQYLSIAAFTVVAMSGWCYAPATSTELLANGGTAGIITMFLVDTFGFFFVTLSLAEMSSIAPTAGGQYHWASEFAPPHLQKVLSYTAGWLSSVAWLAGTAGGAFVTGLTMQGLIVATQPGYQPQPYQGYLFVVAVITFALAVNTLLARYLPRLEGIILVLFIVAFVATLGTLWGLAPRLTAAEVFKTFTNNSGWKSLGISLVVSQSSVVFLLAGSDSSVHMAEETRHAATIVPKAMVASFLANAALSFVMIVTFCFVLTDYAAAVASPVGAFGYPFIQVFIDATGSIAGGTVLISLLVSMQVLGTTNWMASNARQIFAFARDEGFPFSAWIARVDSAGTHPINSVFVSWAFVVLISLITLGSVVAFEAIISLQQLAMMSTYLVSLGCLVWRRLFGTPLPKSPWTLGRFALPVNLMGIAYSCFLILFLPWPGYMPVTPATMNWAIVLYVGIMLIAIIYYFAHARRVYQGPVVHVKTS